MSVLKELQELIEAGDYEVAFRIPGKGGFKRKTFSSEEARTKFIDKLIDKEGDDVEMRLRDPEGK